MKAILFTQEDTLAYDALQEKIHLHLVSRNGINDFKYSASEWANSSKANVYEEKLIMPIGDANSPRYVLILQALSQNQINSIVEIEAE